MAHFKMKKAYSKGWIDYPGVGKITDEQIAEMIKGHTHWYERLDYHRVSDYAWLAQAILMGLLEKPNKKKWFFRDI